MKQAAKVLMIYLLGLLVCSFIFSLLDISQFTFGKHVTIRAMMPVTVLGGVIALKKTVTPRALKIFLIVYATLWALRFLIIYFASQVGEIHFFNRVFRIDLISLGYYRSISRLETPLPFVIFWFINYFFSTPASKIDKSENKQTP